jgi:hypothetical protein
MLAGLLALVCALGALYWIARGRTPNDFVKREPVRPLPSAPLTPELRAPEPSRPAGDTPPMPNLLTPPPSAVPSSNATPAPSGLGLDGVKSFNADSSGTGKKARPHARPISTESSSEPAPQTVPDLTDAKQAAVPPKPAAKPTAPAPKQALPSKAESQLNSIDSDFEAKPRKK